MGNIERRLRISSTVPGISGFNTFKKGSNVPLIHILFSKSSRKAANTLKELCSVEGANLLQLEILCFWTTSVFVESCKICNRVGAEIFCNADGGFNLVIKIFILRSHPLQAVLS